MKVKMKLQMDSTSQIVKRLGLDERGDAQAFHTNNVLRRLKKFMPFVSGALYKLTVAQTDIRKPEIRTIAPHAKYLWRGKKMVNAKTGKGPAMIPGVGPRYKKGTILKVTGKPLKYTTAKNPQAGPKWDRTLVAEEGKVIVSELQQYIKFRRA